MPAHTRFEIPKILVSWNAPTRRFQPKSKLWFVGLFVITVLVFVFLVVFNELLLGVLIVALSFLFFIVSAVKPPLAFYAIHNNGVEMGQKIYQWEDLVSFFINKEEHLLYLKTNLSFPGELSIYLEGEKEQEIEDLLLEKLPYVEVKKTDYLAVLDGFISQFSEKLPRKFTNKFIKKPEQTLTVEPSLKNLSKKVNDLKLHKK